jgi:hypothetical protein
MGVVKILRIITLLIAIVAAFVSLPYVALALVILGFAAGIMGVEEDRRQMYLLMAVALSMVSGAMEPVPMLGGYITSILGNISMAVNAGAVAVICTMIYERMME